MLTPLNQHDWGQHALNLRLQETYNPGPFPLKGCPFKPGDKVIHTKNVYDMREQTVLNGMTGVVQWVASDEEERIMDARRKEEGDDELPVILRVHFDGERRRHDVHPRGAGLPQAGVCADHPQDPGLEYGHVVMVVPQTRDTFMLRQLAYTGLTRAKKLCASSQRSLPCRPTSRTRNACAASPSWPT